MTFKRYHFHNDIHGVTKGFCFQRCYWGPHTPWQTSASQSRRQRCSLSATAFVTCPLENKIKKASVHTLNAGNQSILWPWVSKHCVINAFIHKWEMFCFSWFIEPTRLSSSLSPVPSQGKSVLHSVSFLCKLWNGDGRRRRGLRPQPTLQITDEKDQAYPEAYPLS